MQGHIDADAMIQMTKLTSLYLSKESIRGNSTLHREKPSQDLRCNNKQLPPFIQCLPCARHRVVHKLFYLIFLTRLRGMIIHFTGKEAVDGVTCSRSSCKGKDLGWCSSKSHLPNCHLSFSKGTVLGTRHFLGHKWTCWMKKHVPFHL